MVGSVSGRSASKLGTSCSFCRIGRENPELGGGRSGRKCRREAYGAEVETIPTRSRGRACRTWAGYGPCRAIHQPISMLDWTRRRKRQVISMVKVPESVPPSWGAVVHQWQQCANADVQANFAFTQKHFAGKSEGPLRARVIPVVPMSGWLSQKQPPICSGRLGHCDGAHFTKRSAASPRNFWLT